MALTDEQMADYIHEQIETEKLLAQLPQHIDFKVEVKVDFGSGRNAHYVVVEAFASCQKCEDTYSRDKDGYTEDLANLGLDIDIYINDLKIETGRWVASHDCQEPTEEF